MADLRFAFAGPFCRYIGSAFVGLALVVNPLASKLWRSAWFDYADVTLDFALCALVGGLVLWLISFRPPSGERGVGMLLLLITLTVVLLVDRGLLVFWGRSPWITDSMLHYRHRPSAQHSFAYWYRGHEGTLVYDSAGTVRINSHGFHDDEFPTAPEPGEFRGLIIGDSVTMGHGVEREYTYANQLEFLLNASDSTRAKHQVMNAGVQGYDVRQAGGMLQQSLHLKPDYVVVGVFYNDVPLGGPLVTYKHNDVRGYDYWLRYLLTESGFGITVQKFRQYRAAQTLPGDFGEGDVESVLNDPERRRVAVTELERQLDAIYDLAEEHDVEVFLLLLPVEVQLFNRQLQHFHRDLVDHAQRSNVNAINLAPYFVREVEDKVSTLGLTDLHPAVNQAVYKLFARSYFIDGSHLTHHGNRLVAQVLAEHLANAFAWEIDQSAWGRAVDGNVARIDASRRNKIGFLTAGTAESLFETAVAFEAMKMSQQALSFYNRLVQMIFEQTPDARERVSKLNLMGSTLLGLRMAKGAEQVFERALQAAPGDETALDGLEEARRLSQAP